MDSATIAMIVLGVVGFVALVLVVYVVYVIADAAHEVARYFRAQNERMIDAYDDGE